MKRLTNVQAIALANHAELYECREDGSESLIEENTYPETIETIMKIYEDGEYVGIEAEIPNFRDYAGVDFASLPNAEYADGIAKSVWDAFQKSKFSTNPDGTCTVSKIDYPCAEWVQDGKSLADLIRWLNDNYSGGITGLLKLS